MSNNTPACYARDWDDKAPECAGGLDESYTNERTGSHIRLRCNFFDSCGSRTAAAKTQAIIAAHQLNRAQQQPAPLITPPPSVLQPKPATPGMVQLSQSLAAIRRDVQPLQMGAAVGGVPSVSYFPVDYRMPGYLSNPEPIVPGQSLWKPLGRELLRAALKSTGHALAHFVDRVVFGSPEVQKG